jgi:hypothetical protein
MKPDSPDIPESERSAGLADQVFTFLGLMLFCGGGWLACGAGQALGNEWLFKEGTGATDWLMIDVARCHLLTGIVSLTSGAFFVGKRWLVGGLLLLMAIWIFLGSVGDR